MASDLRSGLSTEPPAMSDVKEAATVTTAPADPERADLNLVSGSDGSEAGTSPDSARADSESRGIPIWLALLGLLIAALWVGYEMRLNGQLKAEVTGLEAKLGRTEAVLDAHKTHLGDIRGGVRDLSAQLQSLQTLVETEPVSARDSAAQSEIDTRGIAPAPAEVLGDRAPTQP